MINNKQSILKVVNETKAEANEENNKNLILEILNKKDLNGITDEELLHNFNIFF